MSYHDEMVKIRSEHGEEELVYRYLRKCKHCVGWAGGTEHGVTAQCSRLGIRTSSERTTCDQFLATEDGLNTIWMETEARIGDQYVRITYKGKPYFVERDALVVLIGYDPDKP